MNKLTTLNKMTNEIMINSLFNRYGTVSDAEIKELFTKHAFKHSSGKYDVSNRNRETDVKVPIYYKNGSDKHGSFIQVWGVDTDTMNSEELKLYRTITHVWQSEVA